MKEKRLLWAVLICLLCTGCAKSETLRNDWETTPVIKWDSPAERWMLSENEKFSLKMKLSEFPETIFIWSDEQISAKKDAEEKPLIFGTPIFSAYFTDLNHDGYPEICADVMFGFGFCDEHIEVYDYYHDEIYVLWDRMKYDYKLVMKDNELLVQKTDYHQSENILETSPLMLEKMTLISKEDESDVSNPETNADA